MINPIDPDLLLDINIDLDVDPHLYFTFTFSYSLTIAFIVIMTLTFASRVKWPSFLPWFEIVWEYELDLDLNYLFYLEFDLYYGLYLSYIMTLIFNLMLTCVQ